MAIFHVIIDDTDASKKVVARLRKNYDDIYPYHGKDGMFFVRTDDLSNEVATKLGFKGDKKIEGAAGVVFRMNRHYSGFTNPVIWEWLVKHED